MTRITIEQQYEGSGDKFAASAESDGDTFVETVRLFKDACMGIGFAEGTVATLQTDQDLEIELQNQKAVNEVLREELRRVLKERVGQTVVTAADAKAKHIKLRAKKH